MFINVNNQLVDKVGNCVQLYDNQLYFVKELLEEIESLSSENNDLQKLNGNLERSLENAQDNIKNEKLIDDVIEQIQKDCKMEDYTAIDKFLSSIITSNRIRYDLRTVG